MTEHEQQADRLEREVEDMQKRSDELGEEIGEAREDWEHKVRDESVPGTPAPEGGLPPEANYTTRGDQPPDDGEPDREREPWPDE
jgi:chromosome segregation ATPase